MKRETIKITTPEGLKLQVPAHVVASTFIAAALAQIGVPQQVQSQEPASGAEIPALGEYWPGQGGHNAGFVPARDGVPAHYLIIAAKDVGDHKWGRYDEESTATSKTDGFANTQALMKEGEHPAALAASKYEADGHSDFHLPAAAELYQCWLYTQHLFAKDCWYWSSTQRSANLAFLMVFVDGLQLSLGKDFELRVRPVRRHFI